MLFCAALVALLAGPSMGAATESTDPDVTESANVLSNDAHDDPVQQVMWKECRGSYSAFCLKLNLVRLVGRGSGATISLFPGLSVTSAAALADTNSISPSELIQDPDRVDGLLLSRLSEYLGSLSLNVKIMDKSAPLKLAKTYLGDNVASARKKNRIGGALLAAGLMSGGTLMAVGMAAMAAMAGKAMMASLLALMLSALAALKGQGGGGEKTTYEVQHAGHHGHYRSMHEAHDVAYSEQVPAHDVVVQDDYLPVHEHEQPQ